jgi:hypothetical protein
MEKFRIKEVRGERTNSQGEKASWFYPQVKMFLGFYRNIKPAEMPNGEYTGNVIKFAQQGSAMNFIYRYAELKKIAKVMKTQAEWVKETKVKYHEVKGW